MTKLIHTLKDPGSAITHFIGMVASAICGVPLIMRAADFTHAICLSIFIFSMILLYGASTTYHTFDISAKINTLLKKIDHMMIFVLIAGSYTPVCVIVLNNKTGYMLLAAVWGIALLGIIIKAFFVYCPKWFSSILYIAMGWAVCFAFAPLVAALPKAAFLWLLVGGILYTIGGVIYALKLPIFDEKHPFCNSHVVFHIFVLAGSACHFIFMYQFVAIWPL